MIEVERTQQRAMIYVINLDRRPDRLAETARQLDGLGLRWQRIVATDAAAMAPTAGALIGGKTWFGAGPSLGEISCANSHRNAWQTFLRSTYDEAIILEDDLAIETALGNAARLGLGISHLAMPIKLENFRRHKQRALLLGWTKVSADGYFGTVRRIHSCYLGCAGYCISRSAAERLLIRSKRISRALDFIMFDPLPWRADSSAAILIPSLVEQVNEKFSSDITDRIYLPPTFWQKMRTNMARNIKRNLAILLHRPECVSPHLNDWHFTDN